MKPSSSVHAKKIKTEPNINYAQIARMASGASGAELANIVNEAALRAVRNHRTAASQADMEESIEVVIAGYQKKNAHSHRQGKEHRRPTTKSVTRSSRRCRANSAPVQKITIVPRTSGALGYTMQVDEGNHYLMTKDEIDQQNCDADGGSRGRRDCVRLDYDRRVQRH